MVYEGGVKVNNKGLAHKLAVTVAVFGVLAGVLAVAATVAFAQNGKPDGPEEVYALTTSDNLLRFDGDKPEKVNKKKITGLVGGESLVGIDFRPSAQPVGSPNQGKLYGVGDQSYIYTIDPNTAGAKRGAQLMRDTNGDGVGDTVVPLDGSKFGFDFNPTVDRLRIVSDTNQNLRINVDTGLTIVDTPLAYNAGPPPDLNAGTDPAAVGAAYRNSQPSAFGGVTELYDIDANNDVMVEQDPANAGTLNTEGPLGVDTKLLVGFDIVTVGASPAGDRGFAALKTKKKSKFYAIDLDTGEATKIGKIGDNRRGKKVEGIAIPIASNTPVT